MLRTKRGYVIWRGCSISVTSPSSRCIQIKHRLGVLCKKERKKSGWSVLKHGSADEKAALWSMVNNRVSLDWWFVCESTSWVQCAWPDGETVQCTVHSDNGPLQIHGHYIMQVIHSSAVTWYYYIIAHVHYYIGYHFLNCFLLYLIIM